MLYNLDRNLLLLNTLDGLLQLGKFLFAFLSLKFQNVQMLLVLALLLSFDTMLQHDCCERFFLFLNP